MTYVELVAVINARRKSEMDHYKMMSYAVQGAMYAIHTGKPNPFTETTDDADNKQSTDEERKQEVETLNEMFS